MDLWRSHESGIWTGHDRFSPVQSSSRSVGMEPTRPRQCGQRGHRNCASAGGRYERTETGDVAGHSPSVRGRGRRVHRREWRGRWSKASGAEKGPVAGLRQSRVMSCTPRRCSEMSSRAGFKVWRVRRSASWKRSTQRVALKTVPPSNRLEKLKGELRDFHSIRINDQWRVIFKWLDGEPHEVRIVDYH